MTSNNLFLFSENNSFSLEKIDNKNIEGSPEEIRAFILARNEIAALPFLFSYYRNMGIDRFFLLDNGSDDGTREYALEQKDVHVFSPSNSFAESNAGNDWLNLLLDIYGTGRWTLVVDADELLIYPHCEKVRLPDFCRYLDQKGSTSLFVFLLDMYPDKDLSDAVCVPGKAFYEICAFFDSNYTFKKRINFQNGVETYPSEQVIGGPRLRKFYPWQTRTDAVSKLVLKLMIKLSDKTSIFRGDRPHYAPALFKVPLIKWHKGCKRLSSHVVAKPPMGTIEEATGALLHFKFFANFHNKAKLEASRKQHYGGGLEYRRYLSQVNKNPNIYFMYEGSRRYKNSESVLNAGLIRTTDILNKLAQNL